ncbi:hypothetical protein E2C01_080094 [Portunus trituberculatus]|uniref:Uncharacterized protein n=1 Tax=Portunus trituberculatus TaxID=210409 RepID=A0A5B7IS85_PORTR|nr:hypothetical protein [Portunus trituberculatus]
MGKGVTSLESGKEERNLSQRRRKRRRRRRKERDFIAKEDAWINTSQPMVFFRHTAPLTGKLLARNKLNIWANLAALGKVRGL